MPLANSKVANAIEERDRSFLENTAAKHETTRLQALLQSINGGYLTISDRLVERIEKKADEFKVNAEKLNSAQTELNDLVRAGVSDAQISSARRQVSKIQRSLKNADQLVKDFVAEGWRATAEGRQPPTAHDFLEGRIELFKRGMTELINAGSRPLTDQEKDEVTRFRTELATRITSEGNPRATIYSALAGQTPQIGQPEYVVNLNRITEEMKRLKDLASDAGGSVLYPVGYSDTVGKVMNRLGILLSDSERGQIAEIVAKERVYLEKLVVQRHAIDLLQREYTPGEIISYLNGAEPRFNEPPQAAMANQVVSIEWREKMINYRKKVGTFSDDASALSNDMSMEEAMKMWRGEMKTWYRRIGGRASEEFAGYFGKDAAGVLKLIDKVDNTIDIQMMESLAMRAWGSDQSDKRLKEELAFSPEQILLIRSKRVDFVELLDSRWNEMHEHLYQELYVRPQANIAGMPPPPVPAPYPEGVFSGHRPEDVGPAAAHGLGAI